MASKFDRFSRQMVFEPVGLEGQRAIAQGRVLIVGVGGLGSWAAEFLARAGVGFLRLADGDRVDLTNIHRQALYEERDAEARLPKVEAAARRLVRLNHDCAVEPVLQRVDHRNIERLAHDVDVVVDGTDNFASRFILNDYCVKAARPWIFAGVVRAEAQVMTIIPGRTPCLRCLLEEIPPPCTDLTCREHGVLGMAVAAVAAFEAAEAIKILMGRFDQINRHLLTFDMWANSTGQLRLGGPRTTPPCPCCGLKEYEFLEP